MCSLHKLLLIKKGKMKYNLRIHRKETDVVCIQRTPENVNVLVQC